MKRIKVISFALIMLFLLSACNQGRSISTTTKNDIKLQLSTDHFIFYCNNKDKKCLNDLSNTLNDNYKSITNDLNTKINEKITVYIYPDLNTFHREINQPNAPDWVVGTIWGTDSIKMVSPLNSGGAHKYSDMMQVVVHEFTHIVVSNINTNFYTIPVWLNEGTAAFEAEQMSEAYEMTLKGKLQSNYYPTLSDLEAGSYTFGNDGGYQYSYTVIEYIVKNYGYKKLTDLIRAPSEFENILGISKAEFQQRWINYLDENYK